MITKDITQQQYEAYVDICIRTGYNPISFDVWFDTHDFKWDDITFDHNDPEEPDYPYDEDGY